MMIQGPLGGARHNYYSHLHAGNKEKTCHPATATVMAVIYLLSDSLAVP
jgi:hypothetical protein